jgi:hypothetical protein
MPVRKQIESYLSSGEYSPDWGTKLTGHRRRVLAFLSFWKIDRYQSYLDDTRPNNAGSLCSLVSPDSASPQKVIDRSISKVLTSNLPNGKLVHCLDRGDYDWINRAFGGSVDNLFVFIENTLLKNKDNAAKRLGSGRKTKFHDIT